MPQVCLTLYIILLEFNSLVWYQMFLHTKAPLNDCIDKVFSKITNVCNINPLVCSFS